MAITFREASLRFITGIKYHKGMLEQLNNMTFIYDSNWNPNNSNKATFPVAFFHVKSCHEAMTSEVSQKQMLFYNSSLPATEADPTANSGLLNIVADNIVIKPKVYKLDVIIPYRNLTLLEDSFVYNRYTSQAINETLIRGDSFGVTRAINTFATLNSPYVSFLKGILKTLALGNYTSDFNVQEWVTNTVQQPDFNKQSLELMWKMRRIVKMKMWNSWEYKYVSLIDMDVSKEGTEDGVYEATLTLQEMPIVSMYNADVTRAQRTKFIRRNPLLSWSGETVIKALDYAGGSSVSKGEPNLSDLVNAGL